MPFSERGDSGINITASGEFLLGGTIGIADTLDDYASASWVQAILPPPPPEYLGLQARATMPS